MVIQSKVNNCVIKNRYTTNMQTKMQQVRVSLIIKFCTDYKIVRHCGRVDGDGLLLTRLITAD